MPVLGLKITSSSVINALGLTACFGLPNESAAKQAR